MWLLLVSAVFAQSLAELDASRPPAPLTLAWASPPLASMSRTGGNGPGRLQYRLQADPRTFGTYAASAVSYEYIDGQLGTVLALFTNRFDADGVRADLERAYGSPTYRDDDDKLQIWRGEKLRVVWRRQEAELWMVSWSWLALHGGDVDPDAPPKAP